MGYKTKTPNNLFTFDMSFIVLRSQGTSKPRGVRPDSIRGRVFCVRSRAPAHTRKTKCKINKAKHDNKHAARQCICCIDKFMQNVTNNFDNATGNKQNATQRKPVPSKESERTPASETEQSKSAHISTQLGPSEPPKKRKNKHTHERNKETNKKSLGPRAGQKLHGGAAVQFSKRERPHVNNCTVQDAQRNTQERLSQTVEPKWPVCNSECQVSS